MDVHDGFEQKAVDAQRHCPFSLFCAIDFNEEFYFSLSLYVCLHILVDITITNGGGVAIHIYQSYLGGFPTVEFLRFSH